jgi:hypothetical protein
VAPDASGTTPAGRREREEGLFFQKVVVSDLVQEDIKVVQVFEQAISYDCVRHEE